LAYERPDLRPYLLPLIENKKEAMNFLTMVALKHYLSDHPGADRSKHHVKPSRDEDEAVGPSKGEYGYSPEGEESSGSHGYSPEDDIDP